jgi:hypothetical protein
LARKLASRRSVSGEILRPNQLGAGTSIGRLVDVSNAAFATSDLAAFEVDTWIDYHIGQIANQVHYQTEQRKKE